MKPDEKKNKTPEEWRAHWDNSAFMSSGNPVETNGYCISGKPMSMPLYRGTILKPTIRLLELNQNHSVLEIGCGAGLFLSEIKEHVKRVVGTDISAKMLNLVDKSIETRHAAAHELAYQRSTFDRILMFSVSQYFPDMNYFTDVIQNALSILKQPGIMVIGDMLVGKPPADTQYTYYDTHQLVDYLDSVNLPYSIIVQNTKKRGLNSRKDVIIYKDI